MAAASADTSFDYESVPLRDVSPEIRLLCFEKQEENSWPICCTLKVFPLAEAPTYAALSYVWGDTSQRNPLSFNNNGSVAIGKNLNQALEYLQRHCNSPFNRLDSGLRWLWVDAVCINQEDLEERTSQVLLMRQIYQSAWKTIVWLGHFDSASRNAMPLIEKLHRSKAKYENAQESRVFHQMSVEERKAYDIPTTSSSWNEFQALNTFMSTGWFSRVWIIQELAVSRELEMIGLDIIATDDHYFEMSWKDFSSTIRFADALGMPMWVHGESAFRMATLNIARSCIQQQRPPSLLELLTVTRGLAATDPRDKIYALLGIATGAGSDIVPDYTVSVEELYMDLTRRLLCAKTDEFYLDILNVPRQTKISLASETTRRLPSWVPDWRAKVTGEHHPFFPSTFSALPVNPGSASSAQFVFFRNFAAAPMHSNLDGESDVFIRGDKLRLRCVTLSSVKSVGPEHEFSARASAVDKGRAYGKEVAIIRADERLCNIHTMFPRRYPQADESMRDVYWQTVCAGQHFVDYADTWMGFLKWSDHMRMTIRLLPAPSRPKLVMLNTFWVGVLGYAVRQKFQAVRGDDDYRHFNAAWTTSASGRRMFKTKDKLIGLGPPGMSKDDVLFVVKGCRTPMLLRRAEQPDHWTLIGPCYVHGFMNGEGYDEGLCSDVWIV